MKTIWHADGLGTPAILACPMTGTLVDLACWLIWHTNDHGMPIDWHVGGLAAMRVDDTIPTLSGWRSLGLLSWNFVVRAVEEVTGMFHVTDQERVAQTFTIDTRGPAFRTVAAALRYAKESGYTHFQRGSIVRKIPTL